MALFLQLGLLLHLHSPSNFPPDSCSPSGHSLPNWRRLCPQGKWLQEVGAELTGPLLVEGQKWPHMHCQTHLLLLCKRFRKTSCVLAQNERRTSSASRSLDIRAKNPGLSSSQQLISLQKHTLLPKGIRKDVPASPFSNLEG